MIQEQGEAVLPTPRQENQEMRGDEGRFFFFSPAVLVHVFAFSSSHKVFVFGMLTPSLVVFEGFGLAMNSLKCK